MFEIAIKSVEFDQFDFEEKMRFFSWLSNEKECFVILSPRDESRAVRYSETGNEISHKEGVEIYTHLKKQYEASLKTAYRMQKFREKLLHQNL